MSNGSVFTMKCLRKVKALVEDSNSMYIDALKAGGRVTQCKIQSVKHPRERDRLLALFRLPVGDPLQGRVHFWAQS